jgi:mRNA interferase RelE/StbE
MHKDADAADEAEHRRINDDYLAARARGEGLSLPRDLWARIRAGESPVRVIREYRGLTQAQLGESAGVDQSQISTIESGKRRGAVATLKALAKAMGSPVDVLIEGI